MLVTLTMDEKASLSKKYKSNEEIMKFLNRQIDRVIAIECERIEQEHFEYTDFSEEEI